MEGLLADAFLPAYIHDGFTGPFGIPKNADLLLCIVLISLSGSFISAQTNFSSGPVFVISTRRNFVLVRRLGEDSVDQVTVHIGKAKVAPLELIG